MPSNQTGEDDTYYKVKKTIYEGKTSLKEDGKETELYKIRTNGDAQGYK